MPPKGKKSKPNNIIQKRIFYLLTLLLGVVIGVVLSNWSYFILDKQVKISDFITLIVSGGIAIYVGSNIQNAISRRANDHEVLFDEIKRILTYLEKLESWIDEKKLPFDDCKKYFKKGSQAILTCQRIFSENDICDENDFEIALTSFNKLKQEILDISPIGEMIILDASQSDDFDAKYREIRTELFQLLVK